MVAISGREYAIFAALAAFIVGLSVLRRSRRAEATPQRTEVFSRMGFFESTRDQVFGDKFQARSRPIPSHETSRFSSASLSWFSSLRTRWEKNKMLANCSIKLRSH
jgi:hypothetical protein